jgi:hypothetical protein
VGSPLDVPQATSVAAAPIWLIRPYGVALHNRRSVLAELREIGQSWPMADGPESRQALMLERRVAGDVFSRTIAAAMCFHSLTLALEIAASGQGFAESVRVILSFTVVFAIWAAAFPRGATFVLVVSFALGLVGVIVGSLALFRDEGLPIMVPFALVAIPSEMFAVSFAWHARPLARSYRNVRRRLRRSRRDDRIRAGGGM